MRELNSLKVKRLFFLAILELRRSAFQRSADYACVDPTRLDMWLMGLDKDMSVYTYEMLLNGIDRRSLIHVDESILKNEAGMSNSIHRMKFLHAIKGKERLQTYSYGETLT